MYICSYVYIIRICVYVYISGFSIYMKKGYLDAKVIPYNC